VFYVEAEKVGGTLKIDQIREVQQQLSLRPYEGRYKVAILLRLHEARGQTQDALLKTLEEPGPQAVFVLTATHTDALLSTITSRCQVLNLRPLSLQETQQALMTHWGLADDDAVILAHLSGGRLGWAVQAIQDRESLDFRDEMLRQLEQVIHSTRLGRFQIAEQLVKQDKTALLTMLDIWLTYWRDVLLLAAGSRAPLVNIDHEDTLTTIARAIDKDSAQQAVAATRRSADYLLKNANTRLCIEVLLLDYPRLRI
jgi:DNA polymerase-3 subunit delta'